MVVGVSGIVIGAFLPWIISGQTTRNSFTTVQVARRLGVVDSDVVSTMLAGWYFLPLGAVLVGVLAVLDRRRPMAVLAGALGLAGGAFAFAVLRAPIESGVGVWVSMAAGIGTLLAAVVSLSLPVGSSDPALSNGTIGTIGTIGSGGIDSTDQ